MSENVKNTISELTAELEIKMSEIASLKETINMLSKRIGLNPPYPDTAPEKIVGLRKPIKPDQFYGVSPITAARMYLETRGEACPAGEVLQALSDGGFDFNAKGWKEKIRLKNLSISMGKNTAIFERLPNGYYGLSKWYPNSPKRKVVKEEGNDAISGT